MPESRSIFLCASGVIFASMVAQLLAPHCVLDQAAAKTDVADPAWGTIENLTLTRTQDGDRFAATSADGHHQIVRTAQVTAPGRYRVSIETELDGTPDFAIEIGGPHQSYARVAADLRTGKITTMTGNDLDAGSEPLGPGRFRWWVDQDYVPGEVEYKFGVLGPDDTTTFPGQVSCRVILSNPSFRPVEK
jgi:hypothetical protein